MTIRTNSDTIGKIAINHRTPSVYIAMYVLPESHRQNALVGSSHIESIWHLNKSPRRDDVYNSDYPYCISPINPTLIWMAEPHNAYFMRELNRIALELLEKIKRKLRQQ